MKKDYTGRKFFRLTAKRWIRKGTWECLCDCGKITTVRISSISNKSVGQKSCGCWKKDRNRTNPNSQTHGKSKTHLYGVWKALRKRCNNKSSTRYARYGGRGIKYDPLWDNYESFEHDMGMPFKEHVKRNGIYNTQLDRINNDGNYSKDNCRWTTRKEQSRNRSTNTYVLIDRERKTISEWCEIFDISRKKFNYWKNKNLLKQIISSQRNTQASPVRLDI